MFASKFSPWHYNNDIFVQLKRGESLGKLISLAVQGQPAWTLLQGTKTEDKLNAADVRGDNCDARVSASGKDDFRALAFDSLLRRISGCMTGMLTVGTARIFMEKRPACISSRTSQRRRCQAYVHRKLYYCGLFSYSKPILSAEHKQTMVVSTQSCPEMARTKSFVRCMTESVIVPGKSYIMELEVGYQTASNSKVKCQGQDILLNGSIQKGIVQHAEYVVQIESEVFSITGYSIMAMSLAEKLACNPRGPALGCVGALHTYAWYQPKTSCLYHRVWEVEGLLSPAYFAADEEQLFYELKGEHASAMFISISEPSSLSGSLGYNDLTVSSVAVAVSTLKVSPHLVSLNTLLNLICIPWRSRHLHLIWVILVTAISFVVNAYSITIS